MSLRKNSLVEVITQMESLGAYSFTSKRYSRICGSALSENMRRNLAR